MVKLRTYIGNLKTDIVKDYKKKLEQQLNNDLLSLSEEKLFLSNLLEDKKKALQLQKKLVSDTFKKKQKEAIIEAKKLELVQDIWESSLDEFLENNNIDWYESLIKYIPKEKGDLKYASNTPSSIIKKIKKDHSDLKFVEDKNISHGFVYISDKFVIEMTRKSFLDQHSPNIKRILYKDLEGIL